MVGVAMDRTIHYNSECRSSVIMEDRLSHIKKQLKKSKVYYSRYSPRSDMMYEVIEADEDMNWMVYEIERLQEENGELRKRLGTEPEEPKGRS